MLITYPFKNANTPYLNQNQNVNNRDETAMVAPDRVWAPQTAVRAHNFGHVVIAEVLT
jgi:hypothetical protein